MVFKEQEAWSKSGPSMWDRLSCIDSVLYECVFVPFTCTSSPFPTYLWALCPQYCTRILILLTWTLKAFLPSDVQKLKVMNSFLKHKNVNYCWSFRYLLVAEKDLCLFHRCLLSSFVISDTVELPAPRVSLCFCVCVSVWHVMVWVCVVVGSIRRGPSLIESLRGWMSSWFTQSCSSVLYQTPVTNTLNRTEAEVQLATASSVWQTCPRLLLLLLFFYPSLRVRLIKGK